MIRPPAGSHPGFSRPYQAQLASRYTKLNATSQVWEPRGTGSREVTGDNVKRCGMAPGARSRPAIPTAQLTWNRRARWIGLCLGLGLRCCCLWLWEADVCGLCLFPSLHVSKRTCRHSPRGIMGSEATRDQPTVWGLPLGPPRLDVKTSPHINLAPATIPTPGGSLAFLPHLSPAYSLCWPNEPLLPGQWTQAFPSALL